MPSTNGKEESIKLRNRVRNIVKAEYEDWLEYRARRRIFDQRANLDPQEFKDSMDAMTRGVASYTFAWGGDAWRASLAQEPGQLKLIQLLAADADRLTGERQDLRPETLFQYLTADPTSDNGKVGAVLAQAIKEVFDSSPNFRAPPVRGMED